jgi:hypothetical protein
MSATNMNNVADAPVSDTQSENQGRNLIDTPEMWLPVVEIIAGDQHPFFNIRGLGFIISHHCPRCDLTCVFPAVVQPITEQAQIYIDSNKILDKRCIVTCRPYKSQTGYHALKPSEARTFPLVVNRMAVIPSGLEDVTDFRPRLIAETIDGRRWWNCVVAELCDEQSKYIQQVEKVCWPCIEKEVIDHADFTQGHLKIIAYEKLSQDAKERMSSFYSDERISFFYNHRITNPTNEYTVTDRYSRPHPTLKLMSNEVEVTIESTDHDPIKVPPGRWVLHHPVPKRDVD